MKSKFIICNSVPARKAQGCVYREGRMVREGDAAVFEYLYKRPSTPADVLTDCLRRVSVGGGEKDEALYCLSVQGTVDDSALVKMAEKLAELNQYKADYLNASFDLVEYGLELKGSVLHELINIQGEKEGAIFRLHNEIADLRQEVAKCKKI